MTTSLSLRPKRSFLRGAAGAAFALTATGWGCLSMQSQSTLDGAPPGGAASTSTQPYVEAYIEYPGPQSKWAGPSSYLVHVSAKDAGPAQIVVTPELLQPEHDATLSTHRNPASALAEAGAARKMSSEEARAQLAHLSVAIQGAQTPFRGCMSPVRVRMIRADGGIFERQGCRSELGWSRAVSESVSAFVDAAINGYSGFGATAAKSGGASRGVASAANGALEASAPTTPASAAQPAAPAAEAAHGEP